MAAFCSKVVPVSAGSPGVGPRGQVTQPPGERPRGKLAKIARISSTLWGCRLRERSKIMGYFPPPLGILACGLLSAHDPRSKLHRTVGFAGTPGAGGKPSNACVCRVLTASWIPSPRRRYAFPTGRRTIPVQDHRPVFPAGRLPPNRPRTSSLLEGKTAGGNGPLMAAAGVRGAGVTYIGCCWKGRAIRLLHPIFGGFGKASRVVESVVPPAHRCAGA